MRVRLRIRELLAEHQLTYYAIAKQSGGRISMSTAYRLKESDGRLDTFSADMLEALCDIFGLDDTGPLLEREPKKRRGR
jgi:transcriptional regulator with XRE-family HTH domain